MAINIVEIGSQKRFTHKKKIFLVRKDFGDMLVVSNTKNYYICFPNLEILIPCNKKCQEKILSNGKNLSCLGASFKKVRKDSSNGTYVVELMGKNLYFHYHENGNNEILLKRVTIPQFG